MAKAKISEPQPAGDVFESLIDRTMTSGSERRPGDLPQSDDDDDDIEIGDDDDLEDEDEDE